MWFGRTLILPTPKIVHNSSDSPIVVATTNEHFGWVNELCIEVHTTHTLTSNRLLGAVPGDLAVKLNY